MRSLERPQIEADELYREVAGKRARESKLRLRSLAPQIAAAYASYGGTGVDVCALRPLGFESAEARDLLGNYDYFNRGMRARRTKLLTPSPSGRCPYCNQTHATTLDHYLPKQQFPEFAILPLNLVPACYECNRKKLDAYCDEQGALFIQPYLDALPLDARFLYAEATVESRVVITEFEIRSPGAEYAALADRLARHFARLDLGTSYVWEAQAEVGERRGSIRRLIDSGGGPEDVAEYLRVEAASVAERQGVNYWRYALLDALAESPAVCRGAFD